MSITNKKLYKFHGGVHPPFHKEDTNTQVIKSAGIPDELVLPLKQHIGNAAESCVSINDKVFKGQLIATKTGEISANLHAPTSGTIIKIEEHTQVHVSEIETLSIILKTDGKDDWGSHKYQPHTDFENQKNVDLLERIQQAGIVGLGGAAFPTAVKLSGSKQQQIKTLIINGAECEPYITCDDRLMRERSVEILTGIKILLKLVQPDNCLIAIEDNKPEAIHAMRAASQELSAVKVIEIPTIYPSGGEKQLIEILTGKEVPSGKLPLDSGVLSQNIGTVYSIYKAVVKGEPLISRIITVTGNGIQHPQNYEVLNGTSFAYLAKQAGGYTKMADHLIMGGPMMGIALSDDNIPVVKASNCALFTSTTALNESNSEYSSQSTLPCIRCGKCMDACPVNLLPQQLYWHIRAKDFEKAEAHNLKDCIDCGCCSYVCPSHIPLVDYYRFAKTEIKSQKAAQVKSDLSRERHEFLLFRKERDKRERDEKRAAHKAALQKKKADAKASGKNNTKQTDIKTDAIKAALARSKAKKEVMQKALQKNTQEDKTQPANKKNKAMVEDKK